MSGLDLDQIVKGAPQLQDPAILSRSPSPAALPKRAVSESTSTGALSASPDPLSIVPSSPPQIYLNLLILEASLRAQYVVLRARRQQHLFFLGILTVWTAYFFYGLFLRPREDGSGVGGSVYWVVEMAEKVALMGGVVTGILMWGTGQWERGVRWPRRWLSVTNRGLRSINTKVVIIRGSWWRELLGLFSFLSPYSCPLMPSRCIPESSVGSGYEKASSSFTSKLEHGDLEAIHYDDLAPGGDFIKLLLLPKPFSADFRENWDIYRTDYWEKENERRAMLRWQLFEQRKNFAKKQAQWLWWTGWRSRRSHLATIRKSELTPKPRRGSFGSDSHSRNTSRSSTSVSREVEDRPKLERVQRGSVNAEKRHKVRSIINNTP